MPLRLEIPHLRAFAAVAELGSFTRAAKRLHLTQSAVSWQVRRLEARIGHTLLNRSHDGVCLTAHGRDLLSDAERVLSAHDQAVDRLRRSSLRGRVRFGCAEDLIADRLAGVLSRFRRMHPGVQLEVVVDPSPVLQQRVDDRDLDAAIVQRPAGADDAHRLWREQPLWVCGQDAPLDLASPVPLVTFGPACVYRAAANAALDCAGVAWFPVLECPSLAGVRSAIAAGIGIGVLAERHLDARLHVMEGTDWLAPLPENDFVLAGPTAPAGTPVAVLTNLMLDELAVVGRLPSLPSR